MYTNIVYKHSLYFGTGTTIPSRNRRTVCALTLNKNVIIFQSRDYHSKPKYEDCTLTLNTNVIIFRDRDYHSKPKHEDCTLTLNTNTLYISGQELPLQAEISRQYVNIEYIRSLYFGTGTTAEIQGSFVHKY